MDLKAIVFDWDQTLWDSWAVHQGGIEYAAQSVGLPKPSKERIVATFKGVLEEHLAFLLGNSEESLRYYLEFYKAHRRRLSRLFPEVWEPLQALYGAGYRLAVLSNKVRLAVMEDVREARLEDLFETTLCRDDLGITKPEPGGLQHVLNELQIVPREALYVGDAPSDMECARRAGVGSVGALWGCIDIPALVAAEPDTLWNQPQEALKLIPSPKFLY